jgi:hypothetical protein
MRQWTRQRLILVVGLVLFIALVLLVKELAAQAIIIRQNAGWREIREGIRVTYVRQWVPDEAYDTEPTLFVRPDLDYIFIHSEHPLIGMRFEVLERSNEQDIVLQAWSLNSAWPEGLTYAQWEVIQDGMLGRILDEVTLRDAPQSYELSLSGETDILLQGLGSPGVGYLIGSTENEGASPVFWTLLPPTTVVVPTPLPSTALPESTVTPTVTATQEPEESLTPTVTPTLTVTPLPEIDDLPYEQYLDDWNIATSIIERVLKKRFPGMDVRFKVVIEISPGATPTE